jgi:hypothetical protein
VYYEHVASLTRDHIRDHLRALLDEVNAESMNKVHLELPKGFEVSSILGGVVGMSRSSLPALAIDSASKQLAPDNDNVWTWLYNGQISGMVVADTPSLVETLSRRYAAAIEKFIKAHARSPFPAAYDPTTYPFRVSGFGLSTIDLIGAANVPEGEQSIWVDGFRIEVAWKVIEEGPGQHGAA